MRTRSKCLVAGLLGISVAVLTVWGCGPDSDAQCYIRDPGLDWEGDPLSGPHYCGEFRLPDPPEGYARVNQVFVAFEPTEDQPCDPCDVERFDELLRAEIERQCPGQPYSNLERGCYIPPEKNDFCWVVGTYSANFFVPVPDHGCLGCDPETGECTTPLYQPDTE